VNQERKLGDYFIRRFGESDLALARSGDYLKNGF